jgi:hypothetical protein
MTSNCFLFEESFLDKASGLASDEMTMLRSIARIFLPSTYRSQ